MSEQKNKGRGRGRPATSRSVITVPVPPAEYDAQKLARALIHLAMAADERDREAGGDER